MSTYSDRFELDAVSDRGTLKARFEEHCSLNGYTPAASAELLDAWRFERGRRGSGWWSSDMSKLFAVLTLELKPLSSADDDHEPKLSASVTLEVDTRGQHLLERDEAFWRGELEAIRALLEGAELAPRDRRLEESARARTGRRETLQLSVYGFLITFLVLFVIVLVLTRLGWLSV